MGLKYFCRPSAAIIWKCAPAEPANKPMSEKKRKRFEKFSIAVASAFLLLSIIIFLTGASKGLYIFLFSGELAAALSVAAGSILGKGAKRNEVSNA